MSNYANKIFSFFGGDQPVKTPNKRSKSVGKAKGKEIAENTSEESNINIANENRNFTFDLKVFGRSIFQNLILTANAYSNDHNVIPIKCFWRRVKNDISIDINGINSNSYIPTAEDVGYVIEVQVYPVDQGIYGTVPAIGKYGPILLDMDMKNTLELLLTSGGTKFSLYIYDTVEQEKVNNCEILIYINLNELRLVEIDYNGKEKLLQSVKYHKLNPIIKPHPYDVYRFTMTFYEIDLNSGCNLYSIEKLVQNMKAEYHLIAMSKQCREIIYLLIQCFLLDEKIKNNKLFTCLNYNVLPQETKVGITDLIAEIKTLREENSTILQNMKILEKTNRKLKVEMKSLEEDFQTSLESINSHISGYETPGCQPLITKSITHNSNSSTEIRKKYDELLSNNSLLISKEKALREENKDLKNISAISKNKSDELEIENKKLNNQLVNFELEIKSLKKSLAISTEGLNKIKDELNYIKEEKAKLQKEKLEMSEKINKFNGFEELKDKFSELQKLNEALNYDNKNLIVQRNVLTNQKDILGKEVDKISKEKQSLNDKVVQLTDEKVTLIQSQKDNETIIAKLNSTIDTLKKDNKDVKLKYELLEVEYSTIRNSNNILENFAKITQEEYEEYDQLKRDKDESDAILMQLRSNNQAKDFEIELLKKQIQNLKNI
jgi:hypothetical protein